jgi:glycosyltransferase involved in cell wall biosynthesis
MLEGKTVAVVIPAYNEETQINKVIETMPGFVDRIVVVNDNSSDQTEAGVAAYFQTNHNKTNLRLKKKKVQPNFYNQAEVILEQLNEKEAAFFAPSRIVNQDFQNDRIILITNLENAGVGGSIARGYKWCKDYQIDCTAVMAGDGQMDPGELEKICLPVVREEVDYVKGNRLIHGSANMYIPKTRFFGNSILSLATKIASGYWRISDTQTGYTAISLEALNAIKLHQIYKRYGMPNDMLVKLNMAYCTIREIPIKPVYRIGEKSKMKIRSVIPKIAFLLIRLFFKRLWVKYFMKDFHPLFVLYNIGFILFFVSIPFAYRILSYFFGDSVGERPILNSLMFVFLIVSSFQSLLFAMWMDIQDNERLYK